MSEETCTHCPHAVHSGPCRKTSAFTPGGCLCVQYPELRLPQPTPAEPRIESVPMKDAAKEWNMESEQFGAQPEPDELAERIGCKIQSLLTDKYTNSLKIAVGIIAQELGRARAGSSLSPDLQNLAQVARAKRTAWHEDFGVPISQTYAEFLEAIGLLIEACERASPPSSPGAAQTCPKCGSTIRHIIRRPCDTEDGSAHEWHSRSPGAPQEQK